MNSNTVRIFATSQHVPVFSREACHKAFAGRKDMLKNLTANPILHKAVWWQLYSKKLDCSFAGNLVGRSLDKKQRQHVISVETRKTVLCSFIEYNCLTTKEQQLLSVNDNACAALLDQPWLERSMRKPLAERALGLPLLQEIALGGIDNYTDGEIETLLETYPTWVGTHNMSRQYRMLRILFGRRAAAAEAALKIYAAADNKAQYESLPMSVAGAMNLTDSQAYILADVRDGACKLSDNDIKRCEYRLMALLANPRCPRLVIDAVQARMRPGSNLYNSAQQVKEMSAIRKPYREIDTEDDIERMMHLIIPGDRYSNAADFIRPLEMIELACNPHLKSDQGDVDYVLSLVAIHVENQLLETMGGDINKLHPEFGWAPRTGALRQIASYETEDSRQQIVRISKILGDKQYRWDAFVALSDEFDGSLEEMAMTASLL